MEKKERELITRFVKDEEMFNAVKNYMLNVGEPQIQPAQTLSDFGAVIVAFRALRKSFANRFDEMKIAGSRDEA